MIFHSAWRSCQTICLVLGLMLSLFLLGTATAQESPRTPDEVVRLWLKVYPKDLEQAAHLTTLSFRQGVSKKDWVETQGPLLGGLRLRYGQTTLMYEEIRGEEAQVIVRARVSGFMLGSQMKEELHFLQKGPEGSWLVNRIVEYTENYQ